ncbi:tRNA pseudouridine synthase A [Nakamurella endophytica]|uniref:tRNA pseudouridine synthase A n=1 Tax=Nakamurella endophytica TaxID=1748367 RepID=A0A917SX41_9ACTN|nr:tRNA pseudouridine(38-40) synthase TruA [Nakamurella endophytica]GGM03167.1 tRNA pseudouridine synthase A [Nakamurella endophytica]
MSYDGTDFAGWAVQPGRRTVAGLLGDALELVVRRPVPMVVAGRTDAGVHATGQVAHVDVPSDLLPGLTPRDRPAEESAGLLGLLRRLSGLLPPDVRVRAVTAAPDGFDARFSALRRHYRYRVSTAEWGVDPLARADVLAYRRPLDAALMQRAAAALTGLHDFAAYCRPRPGATTVRDLQRLDVVTGAPDEVVLHVSADAFCHSMVRALVGALLAVGSGRAPVERPAALLAAGLRTAEITVAPARGLTLVAVDYPAPDGLAARAAATRAVRSPVGS